MTLSKIHKYLDEGATLQVSVVGVTFASVEFPNKSRQELIAELYENQKDAILTLIKEPDNPYDEYAIRVDWMKRNLVRTSNQKLEANWKHYDIGYIPKNSNLLIIKADGRTRSAYGKAVNQILCEYSLTLTVTLEAIYGGIDGKHYGLTVNIKKNQ